MAPVRVCGRAAQLSKRRPTVCVEAGCEVLGVLECVGNPTGRRVTEIFWEPAG